MVPELRVPTQADVERELARLETLIDACDDDLLAWMRVLVPHFTVHPVSIPGVGKTLLQARFTLDLVNLLPAQWRNFLADRFEAVEDAGVQQVRHCELAVLLTELPKYAQIAPQAAQMVAAGQTQTAVAGHFKMDPGVVSRALRVAEQQSGETLQIMPVASLPNRRRTRKAAPDGSANRAGDMSSDTIQDLAAKVTPLLEQGMRPHGIACRLGCRTAVVASVLEWLDCQASSPDAA